MLLEAPKDKASCKRPWPDFRPLDSAGLPSLESISLCLLCLLSRKPGKRQRAAPKAPDFILLQALHRLTHFEAQLVMKDELRLETPASSTSTGRSERERSFERLEPRASETDVCGSRLGLAGWAGWARWRRAESRRLVPLLLGALLLCPTAALGCSFGSKRSASGNQPSESDDSVCAQEYQERCEELYNSRWLSVEARCIHQVPEMTSSEPESTVRCRTLAPGETSGRLLRVNHQEIVTHFEKIGKSIGYGTTYHVNGHRHVARQVGAKSFLDDFRWRDEFGKDIATMYFKPEGWGMKDEFADRTGDCVAVSAINDGGGVIYPMPCTGQLESWCEFDCALKESPLMEPQENTAR